MASTTTTGARPHVEGVRIYTREAGKLVQALLAEAGQAGQAPAETSGGDATTLSLHSADREFLTAERAAELLAPLLAPGAQFSKARGLRLRRRPANPRSTHAPAPPLARAGEAQHQELRP